jgi:hypothetical protein
MLYLVSRWLNNIMGIVADFNVINGVWVRASRAGVGG